MLKMNNKLIVLIIVATIVLTSLLGFASASIWDNAVSYYKFDNSNQTTLNDTIGTNNGIFNGYSFNNGVLNINTNKVLQDQASCSNWNNGGLCNSNCLGGLQNGVWNNGCGGFSGDHSLLYSNYTLDTSLSSIYKIVWEVDTDSVITDLNIPSSCFSGTKLQLKLDYIEYNNVSYSCYNSSNVFSLISTIACSGYCDGYNHGGEGQVFITYTNATSSGKYGNAYSFDGVNDYIDLGTSGLGIDGKTTMTACAWVYPIMTPQIQYTNIVGYVDYNWGLAYRAGDDNKIYFCIGNGTDSGTTVKCSGSGQVTPINSWSFVCGSYDGSNIRTYLNGNIIDTTAFTIPASGINSAQNYIGYYGGSSRYFNGSIDEVRIWNRALSSSEITQEMNSANPVNGNGLISSYSFEQNNATTTFDTNHLVSGEILQGGNFDGNNDKITLSATSGNYSQNFSVSAWIKMGDAPGASYQGIIDKDYSTAWSIIKNGNTGNIKFIDDAHSFEVISTGGKWLDGNWHHLTMEHNGTDVLLYVDGVYNNKGSIASISQNAVALVLGLRQSGGIYFNGLIDEIGIWNRSLSSQEISSLYYNQSGLLYENSQTFNPTTYETSSENFIINITYNSSYYTGISAILSYNGTNYTGTSSGSGDNLIFSKTITIPAITSSENKSFYWIISLTKTDTTYYYSITNEQEVNKVSIGQCGGSLDVLVLNFTATNETSLENVDLFNFAGTFNIYQRDSRLYSSVSIINTTGVNSMALCLSENGTYNIDADIDYSSSGFSSRSYYLRNAEISNGSISNIQLYLLPSGLSTSIIINVKDQYLSNLKNHLVKVMRYYPGYGVYYLVETSKTDDFGNAIIKAQEEDVDYKFLISNSTGDQIYLSNPMRVICTATPCSLGFITGQTENIIQTLVDFQNVQYSLVWNNDTGYVTFTFSDSSGLTQSMRLVVIKINAYGETAVSGCDNTVTGSAGIITCNIGTNSTGEYSAKVYRTASPAKYFAQLSISLTNVWQIFGKETLVWMFFFVIVMFFAGVTISPAIAAILTLVSIVFMMATGIVYMPLVVIISIAVVVIIFIIKMRS